MRILGEWNKTGDDWTVIDSKGTGWSKNDFQWLDDYIERSVPSSKPSSGRNSAPSRSAGNSNAKLGTVCITCDLIYIAKCRYNI